MSAITQARGQNFLNAEFRGSAYTALTGTRKIRVLSATGDQATAGTEITPGSGYTAGGAAIVYDAATVQTGTYSAEVLNQAVSIVNMPTASVTGIDLTDTAGTPVRFAFGGLTGGTKNIVAGDTLSFPAGSVPGRV